MKCVNNINKSNRVWWSLIHFYRVEIKGNLAGYEWSFFYFSFVKCCAWTRRCHCHLISLSWGAVKYFFCLQYNYSTLIVFIWFLKLWNICFRKYFVTLRYKWEIIGKINIKLIIDAFSAKSCVVSKSSSHILPYDNKSSESFSIAMEFQITMNQQFFTPRNIHCQSNGISSAHDDIKF